MESNTNPTPPPRKSFFRRLFSWRGLLFAFACLITLIALVHAVENWRGDRAWRNYKRQLEAKGETFDESKLIPPQIPDDQNFAMIPFLKPMFEYIPGTQTRRDSNALVAIEAFEKLSRETEEHITKLVEALKDPNGKSEQQNLATTVLKDLSDKTPVIEQFRSASHERPNCRFNVAYDTPDRISILLPHLQLIRITCRMLAARAHAELALGQPDAAFNDCMLAIYLSEAVRTEPFVVTELVRCVCIRNTVAPVKQALLTHAWTSSQIQQMQDALSKIDLIAGLKFSLHAESVVLTDVFMERVKADRGQLALLSNLGVPGAPQMGGWGTKLLLNLFVPRGWIDFEQVSANELYHETTLATVDADNQVVIPEIARQGMAKMDQMATNGFTVYTQHRMLAVLLLPAVINAAQKPALAQDEINMTLVACGLERYRLAHGNFPADLNALAPEFVTKLPHDTIKGQTFRYTASGDRFKLYSVGWNETDDGGAIVKNKGSSGTQNEKEGDWVWTPTP
jgi:hypothetical protein